MEKKKDTVLVIEDEKDLRDMIQFQFQANNYYVITADNGEEGLKVLEKVVPDVILLDMNMPKMGGIKFYKEICDNRSVPKYPVFVLTARANMEQMFQDLAIDGFMSKPFEINHLIDEVGKVINNSKHRQGVVQLDEPHDNTEIDAAKVLSQSDVSQSEVLMNDKSLDVKNGYETDQEGHQAMLLKGKNSMPDGKRILVWDNNEGSSQRIISCFRLHGYAVNQVSGIMQCIEQAASCPPSVIVVNMITSVLDLDYFINSLHKIKELKKVQIILSVTQDEMIKLEKKYPVKYLHFMTYPSDNVLLNKVRELV